MSFLILIFHDFKFQKFLSGSFVDFSRKSYPNLVIFDSIDSSLSTISKNIKLSNFYHHFII